jgi:hypothetical protein
MAVHPIFLEINAAIKDFGDIQPRARTKFTGAATIEALRRHLKQNDIPVSNRDVFIKGIPVEIDRLVPKPSIGSELDLVYRPQDVAAVLEVKYSGIYRGDVVSNLRDTFNRITDEYQHIRCVYVTMMERRGFKQAATTENLGYPAYTLHWWSGTREQAEQTGDWEQLRQAIAD